jgi:hypothetical protein
MFWNVEARTGLYIFFKTVCDYYGLIPADGYTIPEEAEGIESSAHSRSSIPPLILKREPSGPGAEDENSTIIDGIMDHSLSTAGTTKRHRHSPSVGATIVSTVVEENEEEEEQPNELTRPVTQLFDTAPAENDAARSEEPQQSTEEAEGEAADEVTEPVPAPQKADAADDEPDKQSVSEDAKADLTPQRDEKQSDDTEHVPNTADEADAADANVSDPKVEASKEAEVEPKTDESSTTTAKPDKAEADTKSVAKTDDPPAEEVKSEK